jgi:hypothetical protein
MCGPAPGLRFCVPGMPKDSAQRGGYSGYDLLRPLIAETNAECACGANQIPVRTHGLQLADGVTDSDRINLRSCEGDHFSEFTCSDKFHGCCAED